MPIQLDSPVTDKYESAAEYAESCTYRPKLKEMYGGYANTDKDELFDFEEINFNLHTRNGQPLITFNSDGTVNLPNLNNLLQNYEDEYPYVASGFDRFSEDQATKVDFYNVPVLPIKSDPTSDDGDKDGISDYSEILLELDPLQSTVVEIDGSLIDDSDCIGNTKDFDEISFYDGFVYSEEVSKGEYSDDSAVFKKPALKFTRARNSTFQFLIKPNKNSDYVISYDGICDVTVEKINAIGIRKALSEDKIADLSDKKMTLILNNGESYLITVNNNSSQPCTVKIQQDNWVYTPEGAITYRKLSFMNDECYSYYFIDDVVKHIIKSYYLEGHPNVKEFEFEETISKLTDEEANDYAYYFYNALNADNKNIEELISSVGDNATIWGVTACLISIPFTPGSGIALVCAAVGNTTTLTGGVAYMVKISNSTEIDNVKKALAAGNFNLKHEIQSSYQNSISKWKGIDHWKGYVNKYDDYNIRTEVNKLSWYLLSTKSELVPFLE